MMTTQQISAGTALVLIRLLVGWVFLLEGVLKFLLPDELGVGRFVSIGIPWPHVMATFVAVVEIVCGSFIIVGLFTTENPEVFQPLGHLCGRLSRALQFICRTMAGLSSRYLRSDEI